MSKAEIIQIVVDIIIGIVSILVARLVPVVKAWLEEKRKNETFAQVEAVIRTLVQAAEQILKESDPTGEKRKEYVLSNIEKLGIEITDSVKDMIESSVFEVNTKNASNTKAKSKTK